MISSNLAAFLRLIRAGETGQTDAAYRTLFGGGLFDSFADHPRVKTWEKADEFIRNGKKDFTTAAGAYQIVASTWDPIAKRLGLTDFSPESQDRAAVALIEGRGALADVEAGRIPEAIAKCAKEWASLPGSPWGQPTRTLAMALETYRRYGGTVAGEAATPSPTPAAAGAAPPIAPAPPWRAPAGEADIVMPPAAPAQERPMSTLTSVLGGAITAANPIAGLIFSVLAPAVQAKIDKEIARHDGHPEVARQISDAMVVAAQQATGQADPLQAAAAVQRDQASADQASAAVGAKLDELMPLFDKIDQMEQKVFEAREAAIAAARKFNNDEPNVIDTPWLKMKFIHLLSVALVSFSGWFVTVNWSALTPELRGAVITLMVIAGWNGVKEYWMGSSRGSAAKDAVNAQLQQQMQRGKA